MDPMIFTPIPVNELLENIRTIVRQEILAAQQERVSEKLLSPAEACKLFNPLISKVTLTKWTSDGLIPMQKIGGRVFYKFTDVIEAGTKLVKYKNKR